MKIKEYFDIKLLKFVLVGVINYIFGISSMFLLYNFGRLGYWGSSALSYALGSVLSFFLNKSFTFNNKEPIAKTALRFAVNICVCYLVAYSISKPFVAAILSNASLTRSIVEQLSMLSGMVLFSILNYTGQRFFAFRETNPRLT
jgi:putative flippase GtrA